VVELGGKLGGGLVVRIEAEGVGGAGGDVCGPSDTVFVRIRTRGMTIGEIESHAHRGPREIRLDDPNLIEGLQRGIVGMRLGERRRIDVPWRLAYGEAGRMPIPPREDLVFTVELIEILTREGGS